MSKEFEIVKEVTLDATPDEVWQTVATEAGLATWFHPSPVDPTSDLVVGWEPGRRLAIQTPQQRGIRLAGTRQLVFQIRNCLDLSADHDRAFSCLAFPLLNRTRGR